MLLSEQAAYQSVPRDSLGEIPRSNWPGQFSAGPGHCPKRGESACANLSSFCYAFAMLTTDIITVDPDILGGRPVIKGTRVPVDALFSYLENNYSLEEFLECFPSVQREIAREILKRSAIALFPAA
jgi:uncharacterized protein (DUF433 family)